MSRRIASIRPGCAAAMCSSTNAGPSGTRRPASHACTSFALTLSLAADGGWRDHEPPRLKRHVGRTKIETLRWVYRVRTFRVQFSILSSLLRRLIQKQNCVKILNRKVEFALILEYISFSEGQWIDFGSKYRLK